MAGKTVVDDLFGFTMNVPDGFEEFEALTKPGADIDIVHAFRSGDPTDDEVDITFIVEDLDGTIGPERLSIEDAPPGFKGRVFTTMWQDFELDAFEIPEQVGPYELITMNVQVPLKPVAIQVRLTGAKDRKAELNSLLEEILAGLEGETTWKRTGLTAKVGSSKVPLRTIGLLVLLLPLALLLWVFVRFVKRQS